MKLMQKDSMIKLALVLSTIASVSALSFSSHATGAASSDQTAAVAAADIIELYRGPQENWPAPTIDEGVEFIPLGAISKNTPFPENNPYSKEKWELGKQLFFDRRLSQSLQVTCASCHDTDLGWADGRKRSIGHNRQQHDLNSPSIINSAYAKHIFWNGRAQTLEQQVIETWQNPIEMAAHIPTAVARINAIEQYKPMFEDAFGTTKASAELISQAIATFMRNITLTNTRFDKFMRGNSDELTNQEIEGLHLYRTKARCINCHMGTLLSDNKFHHLGTSFHNVKEFQGRYRITKKAADVGAFRTPGLRGIAKTAPYLHNGLIDDLETLLILYNIGWWQNAELPDKGNDIPTATLSAHIKPLDLSPREIEKLSAFLATLEGHSPWLPLPKELN
jgi:cytochrome c peroxidase